MGQEIDAALGDVIRSALIRPAEALGDLASDAIGILGDRVKRKRQLNAMLGLEEVRKKLESNDVDMKDITPPKEEELHLLMNGLSLTDDEKVREMWAGLFAKALDPNSEITAERPFISVLQTLSPMDAKVIDFLAFTEKTDKDLRSKAQGFRPKEFGSIDPEERQRLDKLRTEIAARQKQAVKAIQDKAAEYGMDTLPGDGWADNLIRQDIIERIPTPQTQIEATRNGLFPRRELHEVVGRLDQQVKVLSQVVSRSASPPQRVIAKQNSSPLVHLEIGFTNFGRRLATACGLL